MGLFVGWRVLGWQSMRDEALVWAVFLLGGAVLNFMLLFAWNIVCAPYRLERERRKEAEKRTTAVESRNRTLENEIVALRGGIATASWVSDLPSHRRQGTKIIFTPPVRFVGRLRNHYYSASDMDSIQFYWMPEWSVGRTVSIAIDFPAIKRFAQSRKHSTYERERLLQSYDEIVIQPLADGRYNSLTRLPSVPLNTVFDIDVDDSKCIAMMIASDYRRYGKRRANPTFSIYSVTI